MKPTIQRIAIALAVVACTRIAIAGLPLTPSTTYVANSTPVIKAQDLNDLQRYLAGLYSAVYSVKALVIDGTGGSAVTPVAGTVKVSASVSGFSTAPPFTLASVPWGQIDKEQALLGAARCTTVAGTLGSCGGFNIKSVTRLSAGLYRVDFNTAGPNATRHVASVSTENSSPVLAVINSATISGGGYRVDVEFYDLAGSHVDTTVFHVMATGG